MRFLEGAWLGDTPLNRQYRILDNLVQRKHVVVMHVLSTPHVHFLQLFLSISLTKFVLGKYMSQGLLLKKYAQAY
jgi:hypothetical protein